MRLGATLLLAGLAGAPTAAALDPSRALTQYVRDNWQTAEGLPQNTVSAILRTRDGYLWLGTEQGLVRFDGVRFTVFDRSNSALPHNSVSVLYEDRAGRLWIGTSRGLARREAGAITAVPSDKELRVVTLAEDRAGRLLAGTLGDGLQVLDAGRLVPAAEGGSWPGRRVRTLRRAPDGSLWAATEAGVVHFGNGAVQVLRKAEGLLDDSTFDVWPDPDGSVQIGGESGVQTYRDGRVRGDGHGGGPSHVRALWRDSAGSLWVGTQGGGVARMRQDRIEVLDETHGLPSATVEAIHEDGEGSLWIGTRAGGLVRLRDGRLATFGREEGLPDDVVHSILEDRSGTLWLGMRNGALVRLAGGERRLFGRNEGLPDDSVSSIAEDAHGRLWVGTYGSGLARLDGGRFTRPVTAQALRNRGVQALLPSADGVLWIGTTAGLVRLEGGALSDVPGVPGFAVQALLEGRSGRLWIGTGEGLVLKDGAKVQVFARAEGLSDKSVLSLHEDEAGVLWIGTAGGGIARFKEGRFAAVTTRQGLADDMIGRILQDGSQHFWMSGDHGLTRVARRALEDVMDGRTERVEVTLFGIADGMRSPEGVAGYQPAGWKAHDRRLWFPTIRGAVVVDPASPRAAAPPPPVVVEEIRIDGRRVDRAAAAPLEIPAGAHNLEIQYAGLSLLQPSRVRFRIRLDGFDQVFKDVGSRRTLNYAGLPHGTYVFQAVASSDGESWSAEPARVAFRIAPHWYETGAFRALAILGAALALYSGYRVRVLRYQARQRELEAVVAERTRDLHAANRELERLASLDGLTQIPNRRSFDEALRGAWADHRRRGASLAVVVCDVDHFKAYNDAYGHPAGDQALRAVARALGGVLQRQTDLAARYGGEEFALLLRDSDVVGARRVAQEARLAVRALGLPHKESATAAVVTLSLGVAAMVPGAGEAHEIVERADRELYRAKQEGRDRLAG